MKCILDLRVELDVVDRSAADAASDRVITAVNQVGYVAEAVHHVAG
jgi:hypothetical protein